MLSDILVTLLMSSHSVSAHLFKNASVLFVLYSREAIDNKYPSGTLTSHGTDRVRVPPADTSQKPPSRLCGYRAPAR